MNPRVVWYLVKTDWRRLWVAVVALWMVMLVAALPVIVTDFGKMAGYLQWLTGWTAGPSAEDFSRSVLRGAMPGMLVLQDVVGGFSSLLAAGMAVVCALTGLTGGGWSGVRPVRRRERVGAKVVEAVLFVMLPVALLVGANVLAHGFRTGDALVAMGHSAVRLAPLVAALVLIGALCGSFPRWLGWVVGFAIFFVIATLVLQKGWLVTEKMDVWGATGNFVMRDGWIAGLLVALIFLKKRFRSFWPAVAAWPLIFVAMLGARWVKGGDGPQAEKGREVAALETAGDRWFVGMIHLPDRSGKKVASLNFSGDIGVEGVAEGGAVKWETAGKMKASRDGKALGDGGQVPFPVRMERAADAMRSAPGFSARMDDDALRAALPKRAGNMISLREDDAIGREWRFMGMVEGIPEDEAPFDVSGRMDGVVFHCVPVGSVRVGSDVEKTDGKGRLRIDAMQSDGVRVTVSRISMEGDDGGMGLGEMAVVLVFPEKGFSIRLEQTGGNFRHPLLSGCRVESVAFRIGSHEISRLGLLFGVNVTTDAEVMVFGKKVVERLSREVRGKGVARRPQVGWYRPLTLREGDTRGFFSRYPEGRPDPELCGEAEFGEWLYQVLGLPTDDDSWVAREIAPYLRRHADLMLRLPDEHLSRKAVIEAMAMEFPEGKKEALFSLMKEKGREVRFGALFDLAERRGWKEDVRGIVAERAKGGEVISEGMADILVKYDGRSFYPKLLERVELGVSWSLYEKIRSLPGIGEDADAAVKRYESRLAGKGIGAVEPFLAPAAAGSKRALGEILRVLDSRAISGKQFRSWEAMGKVVVLPRERREANLETVDAKYGGLSVDDFEWSPFLRQWRLKGHVKLPRYR